MNFELKAVSSLEKIFSGKGLPAENDSLSLLSGERGSFQLVITPDCDMSAELKVSGDLEFKLYSVKEIYSGFACYDDYGDSFMLNEAKSGFYPDLLLPADERLELKKSKHYTLWCEITGGKPGVHSIDFKVKSGNCEKSKSVKIDIKKTALPEQTLLHTDWFHTDCLMSYYNAEAFSEEYWRITENFMKSAAAHGVNVILTPVFTPALDTEVGTERPTVQLTDIVKRGYNYTFSFEKLDRWVDTALKCGIKYFEISHFFTQWGAAFAPKIMAQTSSGYRRIFGWDNKADSQGYVSFLRQFSVAFKEYTDKKGISDICFIHCSDEPQLSDITNYRKSSDVLRRYFPSYKHIDALSDYEFYQKNLIETPIPSVGAIENFKGRVPELWTYYCCGQYKDNLPNRFFCMPSIKTRILGVLLYKYDCKGFLQWGFNFYYTQYSKRSVNPFEETDAGGAFPSGDSFIVYPGENGEPLSSLRQKVFYDGFQDISALKALEKRYSREFALELIKDCLGDISFSEYPLDNESFINFRSRLVSLLD